VGDDHELYVLSKGDGVIRKMTAPLGPLLSPPPFSRKI
jgi:hypothetical protein